MYLGTYLDNLLHDKGAVVVSVGPGAPVDKHFVLLSQGKVFRVRAEADADDLPMCSQPKKCPLLISTNTHTTYIRVGPQMNLSAKLK